MMGEVTVGTVLFLPYLSQPVLGKDRGLDTPRGSWVGVLMGRGRGTDIRTRQPPGGTLNVHVEFHFAISRKHQSHLLI